MSRDVLFAFSPTVIFRNIFQIFDKQGGLKPCVLPALMITQFCNHCDIKFMN